ncbi:hypothetical protein ACFFIX_26740 [Metabacillus herbersteinensis]|uniref:Uncharacterized protein n=1 Tax=Metabacillus herbersteinensis TaxID=283816 RepID=A0ABV6GMH5_9BACI
MEYDLYLQDKDLFKEIIWDPHIEQIVIWKYGEWSTFSSFDYEKRIKEEQPIFIVNLKDFYLEIDLSYNSVDHLIIKIEDILNGRIDKESNY